MGQAKVGLITNLRNSGRVEVVFADHYYELLEALTTVQITNQLFDYHCNVKQEFVKSIIQSSRVSTFLAPYNHDWDEIHRVRILKMEESRQVTTFFICCYCRELILYSRIFITACPTSFY